MAVDDRRHAGVEGDTMITNMAISSSIAFICQECVEKTGQSGIEVYTYFYYSFGLVPIQLQKREGSK